MGVYIMYKDAICDNKKGERAIKKQSFRILQMLHWCCYKYNRLIGIPSVTTKKIIKNIQKMK